MTPAVRAAVGAVLQALDEEKPEKVTVEYYARGVPPLVQVMFAPAVTARSAGAVVERLGCGKDRASWGFRSGWVEGSVEHGGVPVRVRVAWLETEA